MGRQETIQRVHFSIEKPSPLWLCIGFWVCIAISVAAVLRRVSALLIPVKDLPPQLAALDAEFSSHAALTFAHILPALAFVLVAPFAVLRRFSSAAWADRLIFPLGAIVGLTAFAMSAFSIGGWIERSAVLFFNCLFLFSLSRAYWHRQRGEAALKRRWTLRAIAILLGIATTRPIMGVFFATSVLTHLAPSQFFGIAFWMGFSINTLIFELWLHSDDRQSQTERMAARPER